MSDLGLSVIDRTVNDTNEWLNDISARAGVEREHAYHALRAGLHTLRDRLPVDQAAALGAQLPMLIRGIYYDSWRPADVPETTRTTTQYLDALRPRLVEANDPDAALTARAVFGVLKAHCGDGIMKKLRDALPGDVATDLYDPA